MITVEDIDQSFALSARKVHQSLKSEFEKRHGPMTDSAVGMLMTIGIGGEIKLPNGFTATALDVALLLRMGLTPDGILKIMREIGEKPATGTK